MAIDRLTDGGSRADYAYCYDIDLCSGYTSATWHNSFGGIRSLIRAGASLLVER